MPYAAKPYVTEFDHPDAPSSHRRPSKHQSNCIQPTNSSFMPRPTCLKHDAQTMLAASQSDYFCSITKRFFIFSQSVHMDTKQVLSLSILVVVVWDSFGIKDRHNGECPNGTCSDGAADRGQRSLVASACLKFFHIDPHFEYCWPFCHLDCIFLKNRSSNPVISRQSELV